MLRRTNPAEDDDPESAQPLVAESRVSPSSARAGGHTCGCLIGVLGIPARAAARLGKAVHHWSSAGRRRTDADAATSAGYRTRARARLRDGQCVEVRSFACVCPQALREAAKVVERMLCEAPKEVLERIKHSHVAVIGRHQVTSDMPPHHFLRGLQASLGNRTYDDGCRGVGGTVAVPCTSVGEENLLMVNDCFHSESIMVHEFAHAVMNIGVSPSVRARIQRAYDAAYASGALDVSSYMMQNAEEYWAEGTQGWFHASVREDVNCGLNTRAKLVAADPALAAIMAEVYGPNDWKYTDCCPHPWPSSSA